MPTVNKKNCVVIVKKNIYIHIVNQNISVKIMCSCWSKFTLDLRNPFFSTKGAKCQNMPLLAKGHIPQHDLIREAPTNAFLDNSY